MVARMGKDKGVSILSGSHFNYDGGVVEEITSEMARDVLNFTIEKMHCYTENGEVIPRMNYLRRSDGGIIDANCSVGEEFEVTSQPLETLEIAEFIMANVPGVRLETVATMYNGGTTAIVLSQGGEWLVRGDNSPHFTNCILCNPCTRGKIHIVQSCIRVVCQNTLALGCKTGEGYRIAHTKNARAIMTNALEGMRYELEQADKTRRACEFLASKPINSAQVDRIMDMLYPLPVIKDGQSTNALTRMQTKRTEVMQQFESDSSFTDKSFYAFLSANTFNVEHPLHKQTRTDDTQIAFENITGNRAEFKARALGVALAVAMGDNNLPRIGSNDGVLEAEYTMVG